MLKIGDDVRIIYSNQLLEMGLVPLVGTRGIVTECKFMNKTPGAYVKITTKGRNYDKEWYIPLKSIQSNEDIDKMRRLSMLKSIKS